MLPQPPAEISSEDIFAKVQSISELINQLAQGSASIEECEAAIAEIAMMINRLDPDAVDEQYEDEFGAMPIKEVMQMIFSTIQCKLYCNLVDPTAGSDIDVEDIVSIPMSARARESYCEKAWESCQLLMQQIQATQGQCRLEISDILEHYICCAEAVAMPKETFNARLKACEQYLAGAVGEGHLYHYFHFACNRLDSVILAYDSEQILYFVALMKEKILAASADKNSDDVTQFSSLSARESADLIKRIQETLRFAEMVAREKEDGALVTAVLKLSCDVAMLSGQAPRVADSQIALAHQYARDGAAEAADACLAAVQESKATPLEILIAKGQCLVDFGQYQAAVDYLSPHAIVDESRAERYDLLFMTLGVAKLSLDQADQSGCDDLQTGLAFMSKPSQQFDERDIQIWEWMFRCIQFSKAGTEEQTDAQVAVLKNIISRLQELRMLRERQSVASARCLSDSRRYEAFANRAGKQFCEAMFSLAGQMRAAGYHDEAAGLYLYCFFQMDRYELIYTRQAWVSAWECIIQSKIHDQHHEHMAKLLVKDYLLQAEEHQNARQPEMALKLGQDALALMRQFSKSRVKKTALFNPLQKAKCHHAIADAAATLGDWELCRSHAELAKKYYGVGDPSQCPYTLKCHFANMQGNVLSRTEFSLSDEKEESDEFAQQYADIKAMERKLGQTSTNADLFLQAHAIAMKALACGALTEAKQYFAMVINACDQYGACLDEQDLVMLDYRYAVVVEALTEDPATNKEVWKLFQAFCATHPPSHPMTYRAVKRLLLWSQARQTPEQRELYQQAALYYMSVLESGYKETDIGLAITTLIKGFSSNTKQISNQSIDKGLVYVLTRLPVEVRALFQADMGELEVDGGCAAFDEMPEIALARKELAYLMYIHAVQDCYRPYSDRDGALRVQARARGVTVAKRILNNREQLFNHLRLTIQADIRIMAGNHYLHPNQSDYVDACETVDALLIEPDVPAIDLMHAYIDVLYHAYRFKFYDQIYEIAQLALQTHESAATDPTLQIALGEYYLNLEEPDYEKAAEQYIAILEAGQWTVGDFAGMIVPASQNLVRCFAQLMSDSNYKGLYEHALTQIHDDGMKRNFTLKYCQLMDTQRRWEQTGDVDLLALKIRLLDELGQFNIGFYYFVKREQQALQGCESAMSHGSLKRESHLRAAHAFFRASKAEMFSREEHLNERETLTSKAQTEYALYLSSSAEEKADQAALTPESYQEDDFSAFVQRKLT